jgi:hypothetical protein
MTSSNTSSLLAREIAMPLISRKTAVTADPEQADIANRSWITE